MWGKSLPKIIVAMYMVVNFVLCLQEKKGQEQMKPEEKEAQKKTFEYEKMEKLLAMVRQPDSKEKN